jgi:uncharacterized cupredoxin-like copper-binding protein
MAVAAAGSSQAAGSVVNVALWDKGADVPMPTNLGLGMGGDMSKATMGISATPDSVKPGMVTFEVLNGSKDTIHEMIVAKLADAKQPLPYIADENRVDEDKEGDLGELSELDAGKSGALRIEMEPAGTSSTAMSRATTRPGCGRPSRSSSREAAGAACPVSTIRGSRPCPACRSARIVRHGR